MGSAVFYGPPGSGKTTLARIVAGATGAAFEELSAVSASVADVRAVLARATERLGAEGRRTILFLDEIHRFNKAQQDALLPAVESGLLTLIGATTENPYFEVNSALLSRTQVYELEPLTLDDLEEIVRRGAATPRRRGSRRARDLDRRSSRRRRAQRAQHPRARLVDRAVRGLGARGAARGGRRAQAAGRLRQGRRRALRLHLGVHQGDTRIRPERGALLPGGDAGGRRGSPLHRAAPDRPRLRGHRDGRLAGAARGHGGRTRGASMSGFPRRSSTSRTRRSTWRAPRSRTPSSRRSAPRGPTSASTARSGLRRRCATRTTGARRSSATARATSTRRTIPRATTSTTSRRSCGAGSTTTRE